MPARSPAATIAAEIPYLRSELRSVQVEYESRILDERTVERRAMPVRDGRTAAVPPSLACEGLELVSWPSPIARERLDELVAQKPLLTMRPIEFDYWAETIPVIQACTGARDVLPLHASTVRYSEKANRDGMMTPAGWAHLDYDADEAAVQLRETLERNEREVVALRSVRAVPDLALSSAIRRKTSRSQSATGARSHRPTSSPSCTTSVPTAAT